MKEKIWKIVNSLFHISLFFDFFFFVFLSLSAKYIDRKSPCNEFDDESTFKHNEAIEVLQRINKLRNNNYPMIKIWLVTIINYFQQTI